MHDQPSDSRQSVPVTARETARPATSLPPTPGGPSGASATLPPAPPPPVHSERRHRHMGWRSTDVLRAAALVIALYLLLRLLWFAQQLVLVTFLGVLFGLAATAAVDRLHRWRIPRGVASALTVFGTLGLIVAFFAWSAPTLREQSRELQTKLPEAVDKIEAWVAKRQRGVLGMVLGRPPATAPTATATTKAPATAPAPADSTRVAEGDSALVPRSGVGEMVDSLRTRATVPGSAAREASEARASDGALRGRVMEGMGSARRYLFSFVTSTFSALAGLLLVVFLAVYVAASPSLYHDGLMRLFPRPARPRAGEVLSAIATVLRRWLVTQLIAMVVIGTVTTIVLLLLGVKAAFPLGVLAGLLEFVPTIGPIMSAVPAIAMGFVDSPQKALWVTVAYVGIQFLENHILIPILMKEGVDLPPAVTIVTQALMALVFGFLGLLVAVPMLAATSVAVRMLYVEDVVGEPAPAPDDDDAD